ncbi:putative polyvalent protein kinase domain-containing protein [Spirosoma gilvum]
MTNRYDDEESQRNRIERLPQSAERAIDQESLRAALDVTRRVHRANPSLSPAIQSGYSEIWQISEEIKLLEAQALYAWAVATNYLWDAEQFSLLWYESGCIEGGEHQVVYNGDVVLKRNNLAFHTSYLEYLERLILHNWLFPATFYRFEGLMLVSELIDELPQLRPVVSQKAISAVRGASREEVEALMNQLGFIRRYEDNYVNADQTLFIEDLHDQNVLVDKAGDLLIFDPVIYLY